MTAPGVDDLRRRLRAFAYDAHYSKHERALIGGIDPASGAQVVEAPGSPGWVIVRVYRGQTMTQTKALNTRVKSAYGLPVWVAPNEEGALAVVGVREEELTAQVGRSAQALAIPDVVTVGLISERRFEPGLVQAKLSSTGAYTLSVWVNSFMYPAANGALAEWPGGWLDLSSHVPGAGLRRLVLIGIDPVTRTLTAIDGDTYGIATTLTTTQLALIAPAGMIPLAAVNLAYGQTEIREEHIIDARIFPTAAGASAAFITLTDTPATYANHAGHLVVVNAAESGLEFVEAAGAGPFDVDAPPDTPSAYDDEFDDGTLAAAWAEVDPDSKLTVAEAGGVLTLTMDQAYWLTYVSGPVGVSRPAPSGDFQVVTKVRLHQTGSNTTWGYVLLTFPTAGLLAGVSVDQSATFRHIELGVKDDPDGYFSSIDPAMDASGAVDEWMYLRLRYDSVNKILALDYGADGLTWRVNATRDVSGVGEAPTTVWLSVGCTATVMGDEATAEFEFFRVVEAFGASTDPIYGDNGAPLALDAGQVAFTPTTGADWTGPPATVQAALDELAARIAALEP